jgi:hypothetical protein
MARSAERRQQPRTPVHPFHGLRVAFRDQTHCLRHFPAKVIDISTGGIGVMMLAPLAPATEVRLSGDLGWDGRGLELQGRARVINCTLQPSGFYRVGFMWHTYRFQARPVLLRAASETVACPAAA